MELQYKPVGEQERVQLENILRQDANAGWDLFRVLADDSHKITAVYWGGEAVGFVQIEPGEESFLMVFVAPQYRNQGIGETVLRYGEDKVCQAGTRKIHAYYHASCEESRKFAQKFDYVRQFSSALMKRAGEKFSVEADWPIRPYRDEDYDQGQYLNACAFHKMRVSVGDFPDSVIGLPSEESRKNWSKDAANRFTYELGGEVVGQGRIEKNEIDSVSVRPDLQGRGIGEKLVKFLYNEICDRGYGEATLWCVSGNRARHLYDRLGFQEEYVATFAHKRVE